MRSLHLDLLNGLFRPYSWWGNRPGVRERNVGWRNDYFLVSEALLPFVKGCYLLPEVKGSDHCPVVLELDDAMVR